MTALATGGKLRIVTTRHEQVATYERNEKKAEPHRVSGDYAVDERGRLRAAQPSRSSFRHTFSLVATSAISFWARSVRSISRASTEWPPVSVW